MASVRRIVLLSVPPVRELDLVGIADVFVTANRMVPEGSGYQLTIATSGEEPEIEGMCGLSLGGATYFPRLRGAIDTLLIPGGPGVENGQSQPHALLRWLHEKSRTIRRVGSICTGAFVLAEAGLFDGRRATTHWAFAPELAQRFPAVEVDPDPIWIRDGKFYSSAGVTSGIDLGLALVEEDHGRSIALAVARKLVVFLCRPGNQAQFSVSLRQQSAEKSSLGDLLAWMQEHLRENLSVPVLAARVAMSERNFQRVFTREIGSSPARYVEDIRMEAVRAKLERSHMSMEEIAAACGFRSADVMGRAFLRIMQITPGDYRERFRSTGGHDDRQSLA